MRYFYDGQIRKYILQFIRIFSNFSVEMGTTDSGAKKYQTVPAYYGDMNRQVANIIRNNSENTAMSVPAISCYITGLNIDRERTQDPYFIDKKSVRTRKVDPQTGEYTNEQGGMYTIERIMPTPFKLTMKADMWTSNLNQKLQLIEQIITVFNPSLEIQTTDNYFDWTSLSVVNLTDVSFTSKVLPQGAEDQIDVASLTFEIPIWLSPPAKVKKLGVIQDVVTNIRGALPGESDYDDGGGMSSVLLSTKYVSLNNGLIIFDGRASLIGGTEGTINDELGNIQAGKYGQLINWTIITDEVGAIKNGTSKIYLEQPSGNYVVGVVSTDPLDGNVLMFSVDNDTIPSNTLSAINRIVDPLKIGPEDGLPEPQIGQRYLLTQATGSIVNGALVDENGNLITDEQGNPIIQDPMVGAEAWSGPAGYLIASANDIVEYNGQRWTVVFDASATTTIQYVTNLHSGVQYKWTGTKWVKSWEGYYPEGTWNLIIE